VKQLLKSTMMSVLLSDGVRRLRLSASRGRVDEEGLAELWLGWNNPQWCATIEMLNMVAAFATRQSARTMLECGSGVSTIVMGIIAEARGSRVVALEADRAWHGLMVNTLKRLRIRSVEMRYAPLVHGESSDWYDASALDDIERVDLFICDGPTGDTRGGRSGASSHVLPMLAPRAVIVIDDVHRAPEQDLANRFGQVGETSMSRWGRPDRQFAVIERIGAERPRRAPSLPARQVSPAYV